MARPKYDGVVEAVRYKPNGEIDWVRTYLRRGPTFSDHILLDRQALVEHIKAGKIFMAGKRIPQLASTFEVSSQIRLVQNQGKEVLISGDTRSDHDHLADVPLI